MNENTGLIAFIGALVAGIFLKAIDFFFVSYYPTTKETEWAEDMNQMKKELKTIAFDAEVINYRYRYHDIMELQNAFKNVGA